MFRIVPIANWIVIHSPYIGTYYTDNVIINDVYIYNYIIFIVIHYAILTECKVSIIGANLGGELLHSQQKKFRTHNFIL